MIPDDTPERPLTPGEQAVIADLERRLLLDTPATRDRAGARAAVAGPVRSGPAGSRWAAEGAPTVSPVPLVALVGVAFLLVAVVAVVGGGLLGVVAVVVSVLATALVWPLLPASVGGPVGPRRQPYRSSGS